MVERGPGLLEQTPITDFAEFLGRARELLRGHRPGSDLFRDIYEHGLREAYRQHDMEGLAQVASLAAIRLDADGAAAEAIRQLDFALSLAPHDSAAKALLLSLRAPLEALEGQVEQARTSLAEARSHLVAHASPLAELECSSAAAVLDCIGLLTADPSRVAAAVELAERESEPAHSSFVISWLIPLLFALGLHRDATPWIDSLTVLARNTAHAWRAADAESFSFAARAAHSVADGADLPPMVADAPNVLALRRCQTVALHSAVLHGDIESATALLGELERGAQTYVGFYESASLLGGALALWRGQVSNRPDPPQQLTLLNLGGTLAAAEAVAIEGSQSEALRWLAWCEAQIPAYVVSSLDWPVSRQRVVGLLLIRAGNYRAAVRSFRQAIEWADQSGCRIEGGMARVQLAELLAHSKVRVPGRRRATLRKEGWAALKAVGLDPTPHAYRVTRALDFALDHLESQSLSEREVEVLRLLARGMTYREAANELGLKWPTVQTHAHRIYSKLNVRGKWEAAAAGHDRGIL